MPNETLSFIQLDRVLGVVFGGAVGDVLGAGYEFAAPPEPDAVTLRPGTLRGEPAGHWTDDTAMAIGVLRAAALHHTLDSPEAQAAAAQEFLDWYRSHPRDVGLHTQRVLGATASASSMANEALVAQGHDPRRGRKWFTDAHWPRGPVCPRR